MEKKRKDKLNNNIKNPEILNIDEIAHKKGKDNFMTIISDEKNVIVTVIGKETNNVKDKLREIPNISKVKKVCMDM